MKNKFDWYLPPSKDELERIWKTGILTVDANVLLDLYRYHESTRKHLLDALESFEGDRWISHQAAYEFFRNRNKVIVSSIESFKDAIKSLDRLQEAANSLKGNRIIPKELAANITTATEELISKSKNKIEELEKNHPNFLNDDPILKSLLDFFDGAVGDDFNEGEAKENEEEARRRQENKIPPGYLDYKKDGGQSYGDYYLWRQIMERAESEKKPIIIVTSEQKEDWWEVVAGKTIGPRPELLREMKKFSEQRCLIYHTDRFLMYAQERLMQPVNEEAIEEIRAVTSSLAKEASYLAKEAVKLRSQFIEESSEIKNKGELTVQLQRPVKNFTASGHFDPKMTNPPSLRINLLDSPGDLPPHKILAGTGTTHDFNIHVVCQDRNDRLPVGGYVFAYEAVCINS